MTYADGSTTSYTWDAGNRLTQIVDSVAGTITRTYDGLDRLLSETTPQGSVSYTYDAAGRRTTMTVAGQPVVTYTYDATNRLTQITQGTSTVTLTYDAAGRRTSLTLPNGVVVNSAYDAASRLTALTYTQGATVLGTLTYTYDAVGNRTEVGGSFARTSLPAAMTGATYDAANRQLAFGGATLTYDLNGNLTSDGVTTYTWNARNQLTALSGPGLSASFVYDGLGRRQRKTINGMATDVLYDGLNPVQELSGATVLATTLTGLGIDEVFTRTDAAGTRTLLSDALGSTLALADSAGTVQTEYTYEPFGATTVTGAPSSNPFQYTDRENDGTGLYYYRARYYHPGLQRFVSEDPVNLASVRLPRYWRTFGYLRLPDRILYDLLLRNPGYQSLYIYTTDNPVIWIDPWGTINWGGIFGTLTDAFGFALDNSGTYGYYAGAVFGAGFSTLGFGLCGYACAFGGGAIGGYVGNTLGGYFDPPCAGQLNCGEPDPPRPPDPSGRK